MEFQPKVEQDVERIRCPKGLCPIAPAAWKWQNNGDYDGERDYADLLAI